MSRSSAAVIQDSAVDVSVENDEEPFVSSPEIIALSKCLDELCTVAKPLGMEVRMAIKGVGKRERLTICMREVR